MHTTSASRGGTTSLLSDLIHCETRTTTWCQELPGVWVATRDGAVVDALQCVTISNTTPAAAPFRSLKEARQTIHGHVRVIPDAPGRTLARTEAPEHVRGAVRALGLFLVRALSPQLAPDTAASPVANPLDKKILKTGVTNRGVLPTYQ